MRETDRKTRLAAIVGDLEDFRCCGPSDDPDKKTGVIQSYRYLVTHLKHLSHGVVPTAISEHLDAIDPKTFESVYDVYDAMAEVDAVLPDILSVALNPGTEDPGLSEYFISQSLIDRLEGIADSDLNADKLCGYCRELNSSYYHGNIVACLLLIRTIMNHIPPLFGQNSFEQVAANVPRSQKEMFSHLQSGVRKLADMYAHQPIRRHDEYPTQAQIDPYKPQVEVLLQELLCRLKPSEIRQGQDKQISSV